MSKSGIQTQNGLLEFGGGGASGCNITITTTNSSFYNQPVTLSDGKASLSTTFSATGAAAFNNVAMAGRLAISAAVSGYVIDEYVDVVTAGESYAVVVTPISTTLENNDWATIKRVAQEGKGSLYWNVGDRKAVALSGTVGARSLSKTLYAYIIGFDHNSEKEGTGITFQFGFTAASGGVHVAITDTYNSTYSSGAREFCMNTSATNSGGWNSSRMRGTIIPAFINALPSALQNALKTVTKYSDNTGASSNVPANVTATSDKVFLLAEYELFGARTYANEYEHADGKQDQYSYYRVGNAKIMYNDQSTSSTVKCWTRSAVYNSSTQFAELNTSNAITYANGNYSQGFAPAFVVG